MSTTIEDDTFPADPDLDVRPDPAKLRGYWGDPADRPPRPLWDPTGGDASPAERRADLGAADGMPAGATGETADPSRVLRTTGRRLGRPLDPAHETLATRAPAVSVQANGSGSPLEHLVAILLALVVGVVAAAVALAFLLRPGTYPGEASLTWVLAPDPLKLGIALLFLGSIFLPMGSLVGMAVSRAWGWSALVAWVPLGLLVFNAVARLWPDLAARIAHQVPIVADLAGRLPQVSPQWLGLSGLPLVALAAALLGGYWGAISGRETSRAGAAPKSGEKSEEAPGPTDMRAQVSATDPDEAPSPRTKPAGVRSARATDAEGRDDRRSVGHRGYW